MNTLVEDRFFDAEEIKQAIRKEPMETAIYIGSDSKQFKKGDTRYVVYVTTVILHKNQTQGCQIFKQYIVERDFGSLRQRLMREVEFGIGIGYELVDAIDTRPFEIHLDLNPNPDHKSSVCVKEANGYVLGMLGFKPKVKPEAFAASTVSDRWAVKEAKKLKKKKVKLSFEH